MRMLIADDDRALGSFLARGLEKDGHEITVVTDGEAAIEAARIDPPEMVLLDLNLPRRDGAEVLAFLRTLTEEMPILILTARQEPEMKLRCLEMGADDFMQKPFSFAELRARCRALLRRRAPGLVLRYADVEIHRVERSVRRGGESVSLTNKEFALLEYLMLHRGRPISRAALLEHVWNIGPDAGTNIVDVYVNYLRRKLHDGPEGQAEEATGAAPRGFERIIGTVRGLGYGIGLQN